jgi:hypothetical protein
MTWRQIGEQWKCDDHHKREGRVKRWKRQQDEYRRAGWRYQHKYRQELHPRRSDFDPPVPLWN